MKTLLKYPLTLFAALLLGILALVDLLEPQRALSELENRVLAARPVFTVQKLVSNAYTAEYDAYVNDQFVARDMWLSLKSLVEQALFKTEYGGVAVGENGYLFARQAELDGMQYTRNKRFLTEFLEKYPDLSVTLAVVPYAQDVVTANPPLGFGGVDSLFEIAELYAALAPAGMRTLDIAEALAPCADQYIYYRTDHHWTAQGAYLAYRAYVESLGLPPAEEAALARVDVPGFLGTYHSKARRVGTVPDTLSYYDIPLESITVNGEEMPAAHDVAQFSERDAYAGYLWGNNALTVLRAQNAQTESPTRLLLLKDSYANCLAPLFALHFDEVYVVDLRAAAGVEDLLGQTRFDAVLLLYGLDSVASDTNLAKLRY